MPKKVKHGVGMMEHTRLEYDLTAEGGEAEWQAAINHMMEAICGPDERRERAAKHAKGILEASGVPDPGVVAVNMRIHGALGEDSVEFIASQWLMNYHRLAREREEFLASAQPANPEMMLMYAEELGRYQERLFWRQGADEATGKRRETLALSGRRQVRNGKDGYPMRTDNSFAKTKGKEAQNFVNGLARRSPNLSWNAMILRAAKEFNVSHSTIKRNLFNPKKLGSSRSK